MFGFYRLAAATPRLHLADVQANTREIIKLYQNAAAQQAAVVVFPELCLTGYSLGDLVFQQRLLQSARRAALEIAAATVNSATAAIVGLPIELNGQLFNMALIIQAGAIVGAVPKQQLANYREFHEKRFFASGKNLADTLLELGDQVVPVGNRLVFTSGSDFKFGVEICEDLWSVYPPSNDLALSGATAVFNLACCTEQANKANFRRELVKMQSAKLNTAYVFSGAGVYESTTDNVYAGHSLIADQGNIAAEGERFERNSRLIWADVDITAYTSLRRTDSSFWDNEPINRPFFP